MTRRGRTKITARGARGAGRTVDSLASERRWAKAPSAPRVADGLAPAGADAGAPDDAAKDHAPVGAASPAIDSTQWIEESVGWFCAPPLPEPMIAGVQARGDLGPDAERVRSAAAVGVTGVGQALPHLATIQASFGPAHDLSAVRAHVGGAAADAATSIGATAYATGARRRVRGGAGPRHRGPRSGPRRPATSRGPPGGWGRPRRRSL
jgi:hypothetical protein